MVLRPPLAPLHRQFAELPTLLEARDLLVVNRTQVVPARLKLTKATGGRVELLLSRPKNGPAATATQWEGMGRPLKGLKPGQRLRTIEGSELTVIARDGELVIVEAEAPLLWLLHRIGEVPLPPYIERQSGPRECDRSDYQTPFAREPGAVAAPTAGLHFTDAVLAELDAKGVQRAEVTLHVGLGTFLPIRQEHHADVLAHVMHREWFEVPAETADAVAAARKRGGRVIAVGTTSVRALESWAQSGCASGDTALFITPGYSFRAVDAMVTNFHLPQSTLLMLVSAFAGREYLLAAYAEAVRKEYRFFSYGDAMLVYPDRS